MAIVVLWVVGHKLHIEPPLIVVLWAAVCDFAWVMGCVSSWGGCGCKK